MAATTKLNTHLKQQQQSQQQSQQQQEELAVLAAGLLECYCCIGSPFTAEWIMAVLPATAYGVGPAAELALALLTGPHGGAAPVTGSTVWVETRRLAATAAALVVCSVDVWATKVEKEPRKGSKKAATRKEAVFVSDVVQRVMILHCTVLVHACRWQQQQQRAAGGSSSSSSWAPREAEKLLQQLQFPLEAVQHYTDTVCSFMASGDPQKSLTNNLADAFTRYHMAMNARPCDRQTGKYAMPASAALQQQQQEQRQRALCQISGPTTQRCSTSHAPASTQHRLCTSPWSTCVCCAFT